MMKKSQGNALIKRLSELKDFPTIYISESSECFRVQGSCDQNGKPFKEGFHFSAPTANLGRYNDPNGRLPVCYVATKPVLALAEIFGRRCKRDLQKPESFYLGSSELSSSCMATITIKKDLKLLDIGKLMSKLGITADEIANADYKATQDVVSFFSGRDDLSINGIAYRSRHHDDGYCYALFGANEDNMLQTKAIVAIDDFVSTTDLPNGWQDSDIDGEEILTEILGYKIV